MSSRAVPALLALLALGFLPAGASAQGPIFANGFESGGVCAWTAVVGWGGPACVAMAITIDEGGAPLPDGALFNRDVVPVIGTTGGTPPIGLEATLDAEPFLSGTVVTEEGPHVLQVDAEDADAFVVARSISFTIDTVAPSFVSVVPPEGFLTSAAAVTLSGEVAGASTLTVGGVPVPLAGGQFTTEALSLVEGAQSFLLIAADAAGNTEPLHRQIVRDSLSPSVQFTQPAPGVVGSTPVAVSGTASDPHLLQVLVDGQPATLSGVAFSLASVALTEGVNTLVAEAFDSAGNLPGSATLELTLDTQPPSISILENGAQLPDGALFNRTVVLMISSSDATAVQLSITVDGATFESGTPVVGEAEHLVSATALDEGGNSAQLLRHFTIDLTAPEILTVTPPNDSLLSASEVILRGEVSGAVGVTVDGTACALEADAFTCPPLALAEGERIFEIRAYDAAGNLAPRLHRIRRDGTAPELSILLPGEADYLPSAEVTVSGIANDPHLVEVRVNGLVANLVGSTFSAGPIVLAEGPGLIQVVARDSVDNTKTIERAVTVDTVAPEVGISESSHPLADGALFNRAVLPTIEVADATPWTIEATLDGASYTSGMPVASEGAHILAVTATDAAGNSTSRQVSFRVDGSPPAFVEIVPATGHVTAAAEVHLQGRLLGAETLTIDGVAVALISDQFVAGPFGLAEGERTFAIVARDAAGNEISVAHRIVRDVTQPTLSIALPAAESLLGTGSVQVTGLAGDLHLASVTVNGVAAAISGAGATSTWVAVQVPLPEGEANLVATATDRAGNSRTVSRTVTRDSQNPVLTITDPASGTVLPDASVTIRGTVTEPHLDRVTVKGVPAEVQEERWSADVSLSEGENSLQVRAVDRLGHFTEAALLVRRDSTAPGLEIVTPEEGASIAAESVAVRGTVADLDVTTLSVNGVSAALANGEFEVAAVPLLEGSNRLIARARDAQGNSGVRTRTVERDTIAPTITGFTPPSGASAIPLATRFEVELSEEPGAASVAALRLELDAGGALPGSVEISGNRLLLTPASPLPSAGLVRLIVETGVVDRAGNALAVGETVEFMTADATPPGAPVVLVAPPPFVCAATVRIEGMSEPERWVEAAGGIGAARVRAESGGEFALDVALVPGAIHRLALTSVDDAGNRSASTEVQVVQDCEPPVVEVIEPTGAGFEILFSETIAPESFAGAVTVSAASGPLVGSTELVDSVATFVFDAPPPAGAMRVEVARQPRDRAGNLLAYPWAEVFGGDGGGSFFVTTVIDDSTGRPLGGVSARVLSTDGQAGTAPFPEATSAPDGELSLALAAGTHLVRFSRPGQTPVFRVVVTDEDRGADVVDPRLTPLAAPGTLGSAGGEVRSENASPEGARLTIPAGALAEPAAVSLTALGEQGLPRLLPFGWSPRAAVWIEPEDLTMSLPATLELAVDAAPGASVAWTRLDPATRSWRVEGLTTLANSTVDLPVDRGGAWAVVEADPPPFAVPPAVVGETLGSLPTPPAGGVLAATVAFEPESVLPGQRSAATVLYTTETTAPSGITATLSIAEELELLDGTVRRELPYRADLVLYRDGEISRSRFALAPSDTARRLPVELGEEQVAVLPYGGEIVRGNVVGLAGGSVLDETGDRIDLPAGALARPTPVSVEAVSAGELPIAPPTGFEVVGALEIGLSGETLLVPATLFFATAEPPGATETGILFALESTGDEVDRWRPVTAIIAISGTESGFQSEPIVPADLAWPGVARGGLFLFARALAPFGFVRGVVLDVGGAPLTGALVDSTGLDWIQIAGIDGRYVYPAWVGPLALKATRLDTGDRGAGVTEIPTAGARVDLDLALAIVRPEVIATLPLDGAIDVPIGIAPSIQWSERVDSASLAEAITLVEVGGDAMAIDLVHLGAQVVVEPESSLAPGTEYELTIGAGVLDLQGHGMAAPVAVTFTTQVQSLPSTVDLSRVLLYEPGANGESRIQGLPRAAPAATLVFAENLSRLAATVSVTVEPDGSFELSIAAEVADRILLHILVPNQNEVVAILGPFRTADGRGAYVDAAGASFTTIDGWTFSVPPQTFEETARVSVFPRSPAELPVALPEGFVEGMSFRLDFGGAVPAKAIELSLPAPAGVPAVRPILVLREVRAAGAHGWMLHELASLSGGRLATLAVGAPLPFAGAIEPAGGSQSRTRSRGEGTSGETLAPMAGAAPGAMLPGLAFAGNYAISWTPQPIGFLSFPLSFGGAVFVDSGLDGIVTVLDAAIAALLEFDAILIPALPGAPVEVTVRDAVDGFVLYEGELGAPPADGGIVEIPPGTFGDFTPPHPVGGSPLRFFLVEAIPGSGGELDSAISFLVDDENLEVTGDAGSTSAEARVRLIGLDGDEAAFTLSAGDGSFTLSTGADPGRRYLLAIGARIDSTEALEIEWNESLGEDLSAVRVVDELGRALGASIELVGDGSTLRLSPPGAWPTDSTLSVEIGPGLADAAENEWGESLRLEFRAVGSRVTGTYPFTEVHDVARLGSLLFLAAGQQGLAVLDASDPSELTSVLPSGLTFPLPLLDVVRGVAVDPHGRVLVTGGGVTNFGVLRIFDPLRLPEILAAQDPASARGLGWRGTTIVSDRLGGTGTQLPSGTPRDLSIYSDDLVSTWRAGEAAPDGLVAEFTPGSAGAPGSLHVSGGGAADGAPVTLRNRTRASFERVDASGTGAFAVSVAARAGDRIEVLRNRATIAYLATLGAGVEAVDVNAFYDGTNEPAPVASAVVGIYSGASDPGLELCNEGAADLASALVGLDLLVEPSASPPIDVAALVAFRGIAELESPPNAVGSLSFLADVCAEVDGSRAVRGLATAVDLGWDANRDGRVDAAERERDYAFVSHATGGLLIFDLTVRSEPQLVSRIRLPIVARGVAIDRERMRAYVAGASGGVAVVDLAALGTVSFLDADADGVDDRVLEVVAVPGLAPGSSAAIEPSLGLFFVGGAGGVASVAVGSPATRIVTADGGSLLNEIAPLGVPTRNVGTAEAPRSLPASFRVRIALPGSLGSETRVDLSGVGSADLPLDDFGALAGMPRTALAGDTAIALRRLAERPWEDGYSWYESDEIVAVADPRAAQGYARTGRESDAGVAGSCRRCDRATEQVASEAQEILSGDAIRASLPQATLDALAAIYPAERLRGTAATVASTRWEPAPSLRQEPAQNPSLSRGEAAPGTLLHSGELTETATDLFVKGRGLDFALARTYRNQTVGSGPLGPGWELAYRIRLRKLPNGDVELYDGRGRRETFTLEPDGTLKPPAGRFVDLVETVAGYLMVDAEHTLVRFDEYGRLVSIADAIKDRADRGNELRFFHDSRSRLIRVVDDLGRVYDLDYDENGRLTTATDFSGRQVTYAYDEHGRLASVTSPAIEIGETTFPLGLTSTYGYAEPAGALAEQLSLLDNLVSLADPRGEELFTAVYTDADGDGRAEETTGQEWGGFPLAIAYDFAARRATVTDRRGHPWTTTHTETGQAIRYTDPTGASTQLEVDGEGLVKRLTKPLGGVTEITYDTSGPRRSRGNALMVAVTADARGDNGSAHTLTTTTEYESYSNRPIRIVDPRGAVTQIERDDVGQPTSITEAFGAPEAGTTTFAHDPFGRPTRVTNPNGHVTDYAYFETGASKGYLRSETVDPGGLALVTSYETDARGNVTSVTDPRGVRHESVYNEVDWLVETVAAASGASSDHDPEGLAPALGYRTVYLHDESGQVVEERLPSGDDGSTYTRVQRDYGVLGEVLEERWEVTAGAFVATTTEYDAGSLPVRVTHPEGNYEEWEYDSRNQVRLHRRGLGAGALSAPIQTEALYNADGENVATIDGRGLGWEQTRDGFGRPFRTVNPLAEYDETTYDTGGMPWERRRVASGTLLARQVTEFDLRGRPRTTKSYLWEVSGNDPRIPDDPSGALPLETTLVWDADSRLLQSTDPLQRVTLYEYDAAGRRTAVQDAAGNRLDWRLDPAGNKIETVAREVTPSGAAIDIVSTEAFDAMGRPVASSDAFGNRSRSTYDARGNVRLEIDAEGALTTSTYDGLDRKTEVARPEGILERFEYDGNGRLIAHSDAFDQRTTYVYDAANRVISATHPDSTRDLFEEYDGNDNLLSRRDANGSAVTQLFDGANRLRGRTIARGPGVVGVAAESFDFDGLSRLVRTQSGSLVSTFTYDSLSRTTSEASDGRKTTYLRDDAGNALTTLYPSGLAVARQFDELDRARTVGSPGAPAALAQFRYRGPARVAGKDLGPAILGHSSFDSAGRTTFRSATSARALLLSEQSSYTPRGLATATTRWDLGGDGQVYRHDGAGRLLSVEEAARAASAVANNSVPAPTSLEAIASGFAFDYTPAEHMTLQVEKQAGVLERENLLPADGSGRNRPAVANGKALTWDANGNLVGKSSVHYQYDFHNRLVRVTEDGVGELASYDYDALNRRISRAVAGEVRATVWSGWQAIEEYGENGLAARRVYGLGLDEIVRAEVDLDDDGTVETTQRPIYDRIGNLVVLADEAGKPVERYTYKPFGPEKTEADLTPPQLMQIRRSEFGAIEFDASEGISGEALRRSLEEGASPPGVGGTLDGQTLRITFGDQLPQNLAAGEDGNNEGGSSLAALDAEPGPLATLTQRDLPGRESGRTWVLTFADPVPPGAAVTLTFHPEGVQDDFANPLAAPVTQAFTWPGSAAVLLDSSPPEVERIVATITGVEVLFSEPVESNTLTAAVKVDGQDLPWSPAGSEYRYRAAISLPPGPHQVQVNTQLHDLAGTAPTAAVNYPFSIQAATGTLAYEKPDPSEIPASAAKNPFGFQGLPRDPETGFLYVRNRYFDPEIGRFVTADPLGFVDGPSEYAFATNNPYDRSDKLGLDDAYFFPPKERRQLLQGLADADASREARCKVQPFDRACLAHWEAVLAVVFGDRNSQVLPFHGVLRAPGENRPLFVNGVGNGPADALASASATAAFLSTPVDALWNPKLTPLADGAQVILVNRLSVRDETTMQLGREIRSRLDDLPTGGRLLLVAHSQGGAVVSSALDYFADDDLARIDVVAFGDAAMTFPQTLHSVLRIVNENDPVPMWFGSALLPFFFRAPNEVVVRTPFGLPLHPYLAYLREFELCLQGRTNCDGDLQGISAFPIGKYSHE